MQTTSISAPQAFRVALPIPVENSFDYLGPADTPAGAIVSVSFGRQRHHGVVLGPAVGTEGAYVLRPIDRSWGEPWVLPAELLRLGERVASYYQAPLGMVLAQMLPPLARSALTPGRRLRSWCLTETGALALAKLPVRASLPRRVADLLRSGSIHEENLPEDLPGARRVLRKWYEFGWIAPGDGPVWASQELCLTPAQSEALAALSCDAETRRPALLHGITGSGKTEIYLALALDLAAKQKQTLLLVPEINLTPQLEQRLREKAPSLRLAVLHSGLAAGDRARAWAAAARGEPDLLLGTRLAVFAPAPRLGAIILDEEQDGSYKQGEGVRYHAREVALFRGDLTGANVILGSATPSLESYARSEVGRYGRVVLSERAVAGAMLPTVRLLPPSEQPVGEPLLEAIRKRLADGEQSLLFLNRRGYAPVLFCRACGWEAPCPNCSARLVVHMTVGSVCCHHCGHRRQMPRACPSCGNLDLLPRGLGTQRLEEHLGEVLPRARILRIDRDSTRRRNAWEEMLAGIRRGDVDIMIGTQMLAKGHDFPQVTLVGVLGTDNAFFSADFRASERLLAQLLQVAGRAGRAQKPGEVLIQTAFPQHPLLQAVRNHDYAAGVRLLLEERRAAALPPYSHLALLHAEASRREVVDDFLKQAHQLAGELQSESDCGIEVYSPVPSVLARRAGWERGQLSIQGSSRRTLTQFLGKWRRRLEAQPSRARWFLDVDPIDFA